MVIIPLGSKVQEALKTATMISPLKAIRSNKQN